ncbi:MFS transporter [Terrilactibacillus sp. S3-3]|nr:MFS transporter [Terrilactibacillus sp. S3-3]
MDIKQSKFRWAIFFTMIAMFFFVMTQRTAPGVITDQLMDTFRMSASTIGLVTGIQFLAYAGLQIPLGLLADKFGPAYFLIIGTTLNGLGTLLFSTAPNEFLFFISRILVGSGDAMILSTLCLS